MSKRKMHTVRPKQEAQPTRKSQPLKVPLGHDIGMGRSAQVHRHKTMRRTKDRLREELHNL